MHDFIIVGGGIVGLATAHALRQQLPGASLALLEKEADWAQHQTGRNSGVLHSGIYYPPASDKAAFCREGNRSMRAFCDTHGIAYDVCVKLIVATDPSELPALDALYERAIANQLEVKRLSPEAAREIEPHVKCRAALRLPQTGIVDYRAVCHALARLLEEAGCDLRRETRVHAWHTGSDAHTLETSRGEVRGRWVINCAGLYSDRLMRTAGLTPPARIVPFRGEYYELAPGRRHLVKHLIYPVPNPAFPFLGVHLTRMIDGGVHAGPNAVLAFKREGYRKTDLSLRDLGEIATFPGVWRLAGRHLGDGVHEVMRSWSKGLFLKSLRRLVPELEARDLVPSKAGVRAQALRPDGRLVDDFLIVPGPRALHVLNAPSPAATAALEIGRTIARRARELYAQAG